MYFLLITGDTANSWLTLQPYCLVDLVADFSYIILIQLRGEVPRPSYTAKDLVMH